MSDSWRQHPVVDAWFRACHEAGYCTPDDVELLRIHLSLPKYQMHDLLTDAILPELEQEGVRYRNRRLKTGEFPAPAVSSLPECREPAVLPPVVRRSSEVNRGERPVRAQSAENRRSGISFEKNAMAAMPFSYSEIMALVAREFKEQDACEKAGGNVQRLLSEQEAARQARQAALPPPQAQRFNTMYLEAKIAFLKERQRGYKAQMSAAQTKLLWGIAIFCFGLLIVFLALR